MNRVGPIGEEALRGCLEHALRFDVPQEGSLYLRVFACLYLGCPEADEEHLCDVLFAQAALEGVDPDRVLTDLHLAIGGQEGDL